MKKDSFRCVGLTFSVVAVCATLLVLCGCKTAPESQQAQLEQAATQGISSEVKAQAEPKPGEKLLLREGDTIRVVFPGAPNLNALQVIRRDGKITLPLVGEVQASGTAPTDLEKRLIELYGPQLQTKEITVSLEASAFPVYVTGAVLKPGKVISDRPITALEAIMEAGGFDQNRANMKKVRVIRYIDGQPKTYILNLRTILTGQGSDPFPLRPSDILFVPERFTWF